VTRLADFLLTARELMRSSIDAELITLRARARSTGLQGEWNAGDEFDGLTRALLSAGSRAVLVSLWNVDQRSSFELMRHYGRGSLREASRGPEDVVPIRASEGYDPEIERRHTLLERLDRALSKRGIRIPRSRYQER
jgi:hypothetical protein